MLKLLFILGVVAIPFNDFFPVLPLGEMKSELSAYVFFAVIGLLCVTYLRGGTESASAHPLPPVVVSQPFAKMAVALFLVIGISFLANFPAMFGSSYHGRYPMEKFLTSIGTLSYGFILAYTTYILSKHYQWHELVIWPVAISIGICSVVAVIEMLAWMNVGFDRIYGIIDKIVHYSVNRDAILRLLEASYLESAGSYRAQSICFEPPALANFAGFAWPWAYAGIYSAPPRHRYRYKILWLLCTVLILAANSRTSLVLLFGNILALILLHNVYLPRRPKHHKLRSMVSLGLLMGTIGAVLAFFLNTERLTYHILHGDSVSNLSRFSMMTAAFKMFLKSPVWGYGFGQFGFHVVDNVPSWGYYSWEVRRWLSQKTVTWPPVFSVYARFGAELGILGVVTWIGIWYTLARTVWRVTFAYQLKTGELLPMSFPLIMGCYTTLLAGIPMDSLRTPMIWITMGLACSYIYDVRSRLARLPA